MLDSTFYLTYSNSFSIYLIRYFVLQGKIRKKAKQEPIDVDDYDAGTAPLETDDTGESTSLCCFIVVT